MRSGLRQPGCAWLHYVRCRGFRPSSRATTAADELVRGERRPLSREVGTEEISLLVLAQVLELPLVACLESC